MHFVVNAWNEPNAVARAALVERIQPEN